MAAWFIGLLVAAYMLGMAAILLSDGRIVHTFNGVGVPARAWIRLYWWWIDFLFCK
jgi:hypothetical protein